MICLRSLAFIPDPQGGSTYAAKLKRRKPIRTVLSKFESSDIALIVSLPESIGWLTNMRGSTNDFLTGMGRVPLVSDVLMVFSKPRTVHHLVEISQSLRQFDMIHEAYVPFRSAIVVFPLREVLLRQLEDDDEQYH